MKFLVDTNVLSEPTKPQPDPAVEKWISEHEADFYTSALVVAELLNGLEKLPDSRRKRTLAQQLEKLIGKLAGRILSFNVRVAREWVRLQAELRSKGEFYGVGGQHHRRDCQASWPYAVDPQYCRFQTRSGPAFRPVHKFVGALRQPAGSCL